MGLHFRAATRMFRETLPFVAVRIGVGLLFGLATVLYVAVVGGLLYTLGDSVSALVVLAVFVISAGTFLKVLSLARRYVLYLVSAAHLAVIAHVVETGEVPPDQLSFGTDAVRANFAEASGLFVLDALVRGALDQFNQAMLSVSGLVDSVPALAQLLTVLRRAISLAGRYLDEAVLAHVFSSDDDAWTAARDGVVLYAKTWKPVLGSTVAIVLGSYVLGFLVLLAVSPVAVLLGSLSTLGEVLGWAVVFGVVATVHFGLVQPWVKTVVVTTFLRETREETPDSATMDALADQSAQFRELAGRAARVHSGAGARAGVHSRTRDRPAD